MAALHTLTVPPDIKALLSHRHEAGFSGPYAWAFSKSQLVVWEPESPAAQPLAHRLPYSSSSVRHLVCIMPQAAAGPLAVLLVSSDGNVTLWPDFANAAAGAEPLTSRIPGRVVTLAAGGGSVASGGTLAAAGMEDGSVQLLLSAVPGVEPTWQPLVRAQGERQGSPPASTATPSMFGGMLGSVMRSRPAAAAVQAPAEPLSSEPVVGLRFDPQQQLVVARIGSVECWALGGVTAEGRLALSSPVAQEIQARVGQGPVRLLSLASQPTATGRSALPSGAVLASCPRGLFLATLAVDGWGVEACHCIADEPAERGAQLCASLAAGGASSAALVFEEGGQALRLDLATGKGSALDRLPAPVLAAATAPGGDAWLLLDAAGALHRLLADGASEAKHAQREAAVHVETTSAPDAAALAAAGAAGGRTADAVFQVLNAACQGQLGVASMAQQLASLGALRGVGAANPIAKFSRHVLDTLPKIFGAGGETVGDQLQGKLALHNVLLQCLSDGGCLAQLHPATLRALFEDGQKLRALMDLRELESRLQEQRRGAGAEGLPFPLHEVAVAAGRRCMGHVLGGGDRTPWEVFYACPSVTVSAFFTEVADVAGSLAGAPGAAVQQLDALVQLTRAVQVALGGATQQRGQYQQWFPHPASSAAAGVDEAEWVVGSEVRAAVQALAEACVRLYPVLSREAPGRLSEAVSLAFDLAERLLNAYAAALGAVGPARRRALKSQYDAVRDEQLGHLLRHAMLRCRQGAADGEGLLQRVESLAEAHSGYSLLFDACEFTADRERLYELMSSLVGDELNEPMAVYVFQRLLSEGRRSDLLDLPPQFDAELAAWLTDEAAPDAPRRLEIRWLHDLRVGDYGGAALSMSALVGSQQLDARSAQRLLALDKLAAWAASPGWPSQVAGEMAAVAEDADAKLALLRLQARFSEGDATPALLDARSVMEAALDPARDPALAQLALEAYAIAGPAFQQQHRGVFDAAWLRLVAATPWEALAAARTGSTEEEFRAHIASQPLYSAAMACYGGGAGPLAGVVPPEQVFAVLDQAASKLGSPGAQEVLLAAFQAGCNADPGSGAAEGMALDV